MQPKPRRKSFNAQATKRLHKATSALRAAMILSSDTSRTAEVAQYTCNVRTKTVRHVSATHSGEFSFMACIPCVIFWCPETGKGLLCAKSESFFFLLKNVDMIHLTPGKKPVQKWKRTEKRERSKRLTYTGTTSSPPASHGLENSPHQACRYVFRSLIVYVLCRALYPDLLVCWVLMLGGSNTSRD
jgi:hypothetical protein